MMFKSKLESQDQSIKISTYLYYKIMVQVITAVFINHTIGETFHLFWKWVPFLSRFKLRKIIEVMLKFDVHTPKKMSVIFYCFIVIMHESAA